MEGKPRGKVYIVGAGPGDPELLTLKALRVLEGADVVLYDRLVPREALARIPPGKELIDVGKKPKGEAGSQAKINSMMVERALRGQVVVRLKGGDPFIFGRGGEEAIELVASGVDLEIIPGVSSATGAPATAGIPLTHRDHSSVVAIVAGHEGEGKEDEMVNWDALARLGGTLVILMGVSQAEANIGRLLRAGMSPDTPAAVVERGTTRAQRVVTGALREIAMRAREASVEAPALFIIGDVVSLRAKLGFGP